MRGSRHNSGAFSLMEVVIAVGIFALAVTVVLALLPALVRHAATSADTLAVQRLPDAIRLELARMAGAGGFNALAATTKTMAMPLPGTCRLAATRDAERLHALDFQVPAAAEQIPEEERYFLIEVWSFPDAPLAYDSGGAGLALHVKISWPYRLPGMADETLRSARDELAFNLLLNR